MPHEDGFPTYEEWLQQRLDLLESAVFFYLRFLKDEEDGTNDYASQGKNHWLRLIKAYIDYEDE